MATNNKINNSFAITADPAQLKIPQPSIVNLGISDIENLLTIPIELVPAPGNNLLVVPYLILTYVKYVSAYANGGNLQLKNGSGFVLSTTVITKGLNQIINNFNATVPVFGSAKDHYSDFNNASFNLSQTSGTAFSGGTSTMQVITYYYIVQAN